MLPAMLHHTIQVVYPSIWTAHGGQGLAAALAAAGGWEKAGSELKEQLRGMYLDWYTEVRESRYAVYY